MVRKGCRIRIPEGAVQPWTFSPAWNRRGSDIPRALELFAKAADQQLTPAQTFLGQVYYFGEHGQKKDLERAFKLFQPAAEAGDAEAQNFLGVMYRYGMGITLSREQAVHWWDKAAKQNHGKAQASLGDAYLTGTGVANDKLTAIMYFLLAADQNEVTGSQQLEQLTPTLDQETLLEARRRADEFRKRFRNLVDSDDSTGGTPSAPQTHGPQNGPAATATD
jgi:TPR repeat protein